MTNVRPDYYKDFTCIASRCKHNCCIGWEIDIDEDTAEYYETVGGGMGERLRNNISRGEDTCFTLGENGRCPFLNKNNLCDIILSLGEDKLCHICTEHPRFHNELPGRTESGLGLCCEEASRLILGKRDKTVLEFVGDSVCEDEIIALRDRAIELLQERSLPICDRIVNMLALFDTKLSHIPQKSSLNFLLSLERLDEAWTKVLTDALSVCDKTDFSEFDAHMSARAYEYEQFLVYLMYRYTANASDSDGAALYARFCAYMYELIHLLGATQFHRSGDFTFEDHVELARALSSELEYSDDNRDALLDALSY